MLGRCSVPQLKFCLKVQGSGDASEIPNRLISSCCSTMNGLKHGDPSLAGAFLPGTILPRTILIPGFPGFSSCQLPQHKDNCQCSRTHIKAYGLDPAIPPKCPTMTLTFPSAQEARVRSLPKAPEISCFHETFDIIPSGLKCATENMSMKYGTCNSAC
jgi:hypothetical protein